jgi:serine/threonine protein kinase
MTQQVFNERYRVEGELGRGAMGVVYRGYDLLLQRNVAIKMLSQASLDPDQKARLIQEAQSNAQLEHANIASVHDVIDADGLAYIIMEYVDGPTVREKPPADREQMLTVARQLASALGHAHRHGIVHRDLKPENVIWAGEDQVKLTDFGLARGIDSQHSVEGALTGTVQYMAPEQVRDERVDGRADLYALGVMLFEWLTGQTPFPEENAYAVLVRKVQEEAPETATMTSDIPPELNQMIKNLLARDPEQRYQSADELLDHLQMGPLPRRSAGAGPNNLPVEITSFIGRERLLGEIDAAVPENRVVTLMGVGGCGKTRLACGPDTGCWNASRTACGGSNWRA